MLIDLDFETYGSVDLRKHGLDRYVSDPHFRPLIAVACYSDAGGMTRAHYDFVADLDAARTHLGRDLEGNILGAHNAGFELAVLNWLGIDHPLDMVIDSAVVARANGAASSLASSSSQLLQGTKMEAGMRLIKLFSIPGKYQEENGNMAFDPRVVADNPDDWVLFWEYCAMDTELSHGIITGFEHLMPEKERVYYAITQQMNQTGWPVDVKSIEEMQRRYLENLEVEKQQFILNCDAADLNLNSLKQLKDWCLDRGIKATSFDDAHVSSMRKRLLHKVETMPEGEPKRQGYLEVIEMLTTKQALGGSSLKKLAVILNTVGNDGRLRDQYMHVGAGQTWRTTGRSVQMQNLKRFEGEPADMATLMDDTIDWTNDEMALNIRQGFTSSHEDGALIVGDFSSVESRGLAWQAGEAWKLDAYRLERDVYKDLAAKIYGSRYEDITKTQRQTGKVGELSCGYGAGAGAVQSFAAGMGVELSEGEASKLVVDWREADPETVKYWYELDAMLHQVVEGNRVSVSRSLPDDFSLMINEISSPQSLLDQVGPSTHLRSIEVVVYDSRGELFLRRVFIGCHIRGRNIGYFKPTDRVNGDLWDNMYTNSKTKRREFHNLYGGKLAGILTQSFCRELFFQSLLRVSEWVKRFPNLTLIGQFHDEIVLDWVPLVGPDAISLEAAKGALEILMSAPGLAKSFPLAAEIKHDYRYTK